MDAVVELKQWILTKCRVNANCKEEKDNSLGGALTPNTIPEFVIPGSQDSSRRASNCSSDVASLDDELSYRSLSPRHSLESARTSPGFSPLGSHSGLDVPNNGGIPKSCPVSPRHEVKPLASNVTSKSLGYIGQGDTNSDPLSLAAMTLPHFKARTSFGFSTLSQSPHTRRKESLFHVNGEGLLSARDARRLKSLESLSIRGRPEMLESIQRISDSDSMLNQNTPSVIVTPSASQNAVKTPIKSSPEHRASNQFLSASRGYIKNDSPSMRNFKKSNRYYRRRSSLVILENDTGSSDESFRAGDSSAEHTPDMKRKSLTALQSSQPKEISNAQPKRHSAPLICEPDSLSSSENTSKSPITCEFLAEHGELKFAFQFLAASKVLKVTLIKAEHLGGHGKTDFNLNPYAKLYLIPGKIQKQASEVHKHTRNPVFNQEFYFQGLSLQQLHSLSLRIKLFHRAHNLRLAEFIGKVDLELDSFDLLTENRMWKDLDGKREREVRILKLFNLRNILVAIRIRRS